MGPQRRFAVALVCAALVVATYFVAGVRFFGIPPPAEHRFDRLSGDGAPLHVYVEVLAFDPMRDTLDVRFDFSLTASQLGRRFDAVATRDITVQVADGEAHRAFTLRRGEAMAPVQATITVKRGTIDAYPFDRYKAELVIDARDGPDPAQSQLVPMGVTVWSRLAAWDIRMTRAERPISPASIDLDISVVRLGPLRFFAVTFYAAMAVIGVAGITIGLLIATRVRRADTTMAAVLSGMTFSLPALRNVMPGAPPLGVRADSLVFLWAEVAVVVGLGLVVMTWARRGEGV